jgi:hypothetical protein
MSQTETLEKSSQATIVEATLAYITTSDYEGEGDVESLHVRFTLNREPLHAGSLIFQIAYSDDGESEIGAVLHQDDIGVLRDITLACVQSISSPIDEQVLTYLFIRLSVEEIGLLVCRRALRWTF